MAAIKSSPIEHLPVAHLQLQQRGLELTGPVRIAAPKTGHMIVATLNHRWCIASSGRILPTMLNSPLFLTVALVAIVVAYAIYVIVY